MEILDLLLAQVAQNERESPIVRGSPAHSDP